MLNKDICRQCNIQNGNAVAIDQFDVWWDDFDFLFCPHVKTAYSDKGSSIHNYHAIPKECKYAVEQVVEQQ